MKKLVVFFTLTFILTSCQKEVFNNEPEQKIEQFVTANITSTPSNARIYIDEKDSGFNTPCQYKWLSLGFHKITLKLALYDDYNFSGNYTIPTVISLNYNFLENQNNYGSIYCYSQPSGASIYLNDTLLQNHTPFEIKKLIPGYYKIKYELPFHWSDSTIVVVYSKKQTYANISLIDTSKYVIYKKYNYNMLSDNINFLSVDKSNHIWVGTTIGIQEIIGNKAKIYNATNTPMKSENINTIHIDKLDRKWVGTPNSLVMYDGTEWRDYSSIVGDVSVNSIASDDQNNIYLATYSGLIKIDNQNNVKMFNTTNSKIGDNNLKSIVVDRNGIVWIGSVYSGVIKYDGTEFEIFNSEKMGIKISNQINCLSIDKNNVLWGISNSNGIIKYDNKTWTLETAIHSSLFINCIEDNVIICCKWSFSIKKISSGIIKTYTDYNFGMNTLWAQSSTIDGEGNLFIGTYGEGLLKIKKGNF